MSKVNSSIGSFRIVVRRLRVRIEPGDWTSIFLQGLAFQDFLICFLFTARGFLLRGWVTPADGFPLLSSSGQIIRACPLLSSFVFLFSMTENWTILKRQLRAKRILESLLEFRRLCIWKFSVRVLKDSLSRVDQWCVKLLQLAQLMGTFVKHAKGR